MTKANHEHYYLSEKGLENLKYKLAELRARRKEQTLALATLREEQSDDVSVEDASFIYAMSMIESIDGEIERTEHILANAEVVKNGTEKPEKVTLGSHIKLEGNGRNFEYTIVHSLEADPSSGKISSESPLGRILIGKRLLDIVTFNHSVRRKPLSLKLVGIS